MADADWHRYRSLRGKPLPQHVDLFETQYVQKKILKNDFYAAVAVFERADGRHSPEAPRQVLYKVYHTDSLWGLPLGWLGRALARREARHFELLAGIPGVPRLLARLGESTLVREFINGCNLREFRERSCPDARYFPELKRILAEVHARNLSHNDLSKPENLLVCDDGGPGIIDLQIAFAPRLLRWPVIGHLAGAVLRYLQSVDRYHIDKLHSRARPGDFTAEECERATRKGVLLLLHGWLLRKPYRAVRHYVIKPLLLKKRTSDRAA